MKILMINKFLYPNGGSETYMFGLGNYLQSAGHQVEYFGMEHEGRCVGNHAQSYTSDMDFHGGSKLSKLTYPLKTIYSSEAREKLRLVLEDFQPDVCHLNNFNYQLTPSVILEIASWREKSGHPCRIIFTAHDFQLLCPNHMLRDPGKNSNCEKCLGGHFMNCTKNRCIHGSLAKSLVGSAEAFYWKKRDTYRLIDRIVCCSSFMKEKMDTNPVFAAKTIAMHNFLSEEVSASAAKKTEPGYVLYFGRYSKEKGIQTLLEACRALPQITFVFAGSGPLEEEVNALAQEKRLTEVNPMTGTFSNVVNKGFTRGAALKELIQNALFSVYPSEWYENCPLSVMESQALGTPVIGADIGGIPELITDARTDEDKATGELFESGNTQMLVKTIRSLYNDTEKRNKLTANCCMVHFDSAKEYTEKLMEIYRS